MANVWNGSKVVAEVADELLRDFFDEVLIEGKTLLEALNDYDEHPREVLSEYIIQRLAEVNPGYLPMIGGVENA